jgi:hypothetical protein
MLGGVLYKLHDYRICCTGNPQFNWLSRIIPMKVFSFLPENVAGLTRSPRVHGNIGKRA